MNCLVSPKGNIGKIPVDLTNFLRNWQEESRISTPLTQYDSPLRKTYLGAAKYHHQKENQNQPNVYTLATDPETGVVSDFEKQRYLADN